MTKGVLPGPKERRGGRQRLLGQPELTTAAAFRDQVTTPRGPGTGGAHQVHVSGATWSPGHLPPCPGYVFNAILKCPRWSAGGIFVLWATPQRMQGKYHLVPSLTDTLAHTQSACRKWKVWRHEKVRPGGSTRTALLRPGTPAPTPWAATGRRAQHLDPTPPLSPLAPSTQV